MTTPTPPIVAALLGPTGPQIDCDACFELLDSYVEQQIDGRDADASTPGMRTHLAGCPACHEEHESLRAFVMTSRKDGDDA
jgi:hypothetical protein